ncbi:MAG: HAD hydrolase-like protein [Planctomycetaceae bacterium]|nr:HAD hydrolase-like protein [Planctomycetaceae bacterium]
MPQTLTEYIAALDERSDLIWPKPPAAKPIKATPACQPLPGLRCVLWSPYGTLLRIDTGELHLEHPQPLRMSIALQKTIDEFKMWVSMSRKPGQPWEYLLQQYTKLIEDARLKATPKGDTPEVDAAEIWDKLIERLERNEYQWDRGLYGDRGALAQKVAYFFHASLQGVAAADGAVDLLTPLPAAGIRCGVLGDGQCFTPGQILRAFGEQRRLQSISEVLAPDLIVLSSQIGVRQPSPSLMQAAVEALARSGLRPSQVLYVSHRHIRDLVPAKQAGLRTALLVADGHCTQVDKADLKDPEKRPDRLMTSLDQVRRIIGV